MFKKEVFLSKKCSTRTSLTEFIIIGVEVYLFNSFMIFKRRKSFESGFLNIRVSIVFIDFLDFIIFV